MLSSPDYDFSALWTLMWGWIGASNPITIVALITVVVVFPVVFLATKTIARAFSQHIGIRDNKILPAAVPHRGANGNAPRPAARSAVTLGPGIKVIQEVGLVENVDNVVCQSSGCLLRQHSNVEQGAQLKQKNHKLHCCTNRNKISLYSRHRVIIEKRNK